MKKAKVLMIICFSLMAFAFSACRNNTAENLNSSSATPPHSKTFSKIEEVDFKNFTYPYPDQSEGNKFTAVSSNLLQISAQQTEKTYSPVRKVDFRNFAYAYPQDSSEKFALVDGKKERTESEDGARLGKIEYGDVTNDGEEEALLRISPDTGGNCQCEMVFVYTLENGKPKLLWSFDTEDRAAGGLKKTYAEKGKLVVETFGDTRFENGEWDFRMPEGRAGGLCCPTAYTKISFEWNGEKFAPAGEREIHDYKIYKYN